jgi:hypothetical protein
VNVNVKLFILPPGNVPVFSVCHGLQAVF